ncbi:hypothetical protein LCGC14_1820510 [marine sediment metagenome]|uniref:Uncharacterized protein n=1 Tax=marine sediment metagenome TaxID=412755 RepID=A0A0F9H793_9ZZZZ
MKTRNGFVSNSSSSSFVITNTSDETKTLVDFVRENPQLVELWKQEYDGGDTLGNLIKSAEENDFDLLPGDNSCVFGDRQGTTIGRVFDYILRSGGKSENFIWEFDEYLR